MSKSASDDRTVHQKQISKDGIELDLDITGRCTECDEELTESPIAPQLRCPGCGATYASMYRITKVRRDD